MSYTLQVWEQPIESAYPNNSKESLEFVGKISLLKGGQNSKFMKLADRLVESFPDYLMMMEEDDDASLDECAWTNVPLDGKTEYLVFNIGINIDMVDEVLHLVVKEAVKLGLSVFDMQSGDTWLGNGKRFSVEKTENNSENEELDKVVYNKLKKFFIVNGYEPCDDEMSFLRKDLDFLYKIYIEPYNSRKDAFTVNAIGVIRKVLIRKQSIYELMKIKYDNMPIYKIEQYRWLKDKSPFLKQHGCYYELDNYSKIDELIENLFENIGKKLFPILEECSNVNGLDKYLNCWSKLGISPVKGMTGTGIEELIVAQIAGNPKLQELCNKYEKIYSGKKDDDSRIVLQYIDILRKGMLYKEEDKSSVKRYIEIWEQPSYKRYPESIEEVVRYVKRIKNSTAEQNPKFIQLAEILKSKFPDYIQLTRIVQEISSEQCVWEDSLLNGKSEYEVLSLRVNPLNIEDIKDTVVKETRKLGLSVLFEEERSAYLGNGVEFIGKFENKNIYYHTIPAWPVCCIMVYERIKPFLLENGFEANESCLSFTKKIINGNVEIRIRWDRQQFLYTTFDIAINIEIDYISNLLNSLYNEREYEKNIYLSWEGLMRNEDEYFLGMFNHYQCKSYNSIDDIAEHLILKLKNTVFPFFNECSSMEKLAKYQQLEYTQKRSGIYFTTCSEYINLLIAYFGKNPEFQKLYDKCYESLAQKKKEKNMYVDDLVTYKVFEYISKL